MPTRRELRNGFGFRVGRPLGAAAGTDSPAFGSVGRPLFFYFLLPWILLKDHSIKETITYMVTPPKKIQKPVTILWHLLYLHQPAVSDMEGFAALQTLQLFLLAAGDENLPPFNAVQDEKLPFCVQL